MTTLKKPRVMWLVDHTVARQFEIPMLKQLGFSECFLPKQLPDDPSVHSRSIDYSEDVYLSIPESDLAVLNETDWYTSPGSDAWEIANRHFDIFCFNVENHKLLVSASRRFAGIIIGRAYSTLPPTETYSRLITEATNGSAESIIRKLGKRFWFACGYPGQENREAPFLRDRMLYLPFGLATVETKQQWTGSQKTLFFDCANIGVSAHAKKDYFDFSGEFKTIPHVIGGAQPIKIKDANVLGNVSQEEYDRCFIELGVLFSQSTKAFYLPAAAFQAIRHGMPVVFMQGGILDALGGSALPGRARTIKEARRKIHRILKNDISFIRSIQHGQKSLLESVSSEHTRTAWSNGMASILATLEDSEANRPIVLRKASSRVAIIVPAPYRGGTLRGAKLIAEAIRLGAEQANENVEVVFGHIDDKGYANNEFADLSPAILRRPFEWRVLNRAEAYRTLTYGGVIRSLTEEFYQIPDDGINQFFDCDLWVIVSDRLEYSILPLRSCALMVYDYLQRYENLLSDTLNYRRLVAAQTAERVLVTTEFTRNDAIQFAGVPEDKVLKVPMLTPQFEARSVSPSSDRGKYFVWTTNLSVHKNHARTIEALSIYYDKHGGQLECRVTGVGTAKLLSGDAQHLEGLKKIVTSSSLLRRNLNLRGELPDSRYRHELGNSAFLLHSGRIDNGTFSVVEAASVGVPSLSSDYPAMREINEQFNLCLSWMDPDDPESIAKGLKDMELQSQSIKTRLPTSTDLARQDITHLAASYWRAIKTCL